MRITRGQLRRIIKEEARRLREAAAQKPAMPSTLEQVVKTMKRATAGMARDERASFIQDALDNLVADLKASSLDDVWFGSIYSPYGRRLVAGRKGQLLTMFWDEGSWEPGPQPGFERGSEGV